MWVVPDKESLLCKVAVQILVASIQLIIGLPGTDSHTHSKDPLFVVQYKKAAVITLLARFNIHHCYSYQSGQNGNIIKVLGIYHMTDIR